MGGISSKEFLPRCGGVWKFGVCGGVIIHHPLEVSMLFFLERLDVFMLGEFRGCLKGFHKCERCWRSLGSWLNFKGVWPNASGSTRN